MFEVNPKAVNTGGRIFKYSFNFFTQSGFQYLVAIYLKHPIVSALRDRPVFLLRRLLIFVLKDASPILTTDVESVVSTERIDYQNLVSPTNRLEGRADYPGVIEGRQQYTEFCSHLQFEPMKMGLPRALARFNAPGAGH